MIKKKDYRNFYKINLLSGTCGSTDIVVEFILGPPTPEGRVTVGDTHVTEQDLTRPVALIILHTERRKFLYKNKNSLCKLQCLTMFYSKAFKDGMFNGIVHLRSKLSF